MNWWELCAYLLFNDDYYQFRVLRFERKTCIGTALKITALSKVLGREPLVGYCFIHNECNFFPIMTSIHACHSLLDAAMNMILIIFSFILFIWSRLCEFCGCYTSLALLYLSEVGFGFVSIGCRTTVIFILALFYPFGVSFVSFLSIQLYFQPYFDEGWNSFHPNFLQLNPT